MKFSKEDNWSEYPGLRKRAIVWSVAEPNQRHIAFSSWVDGVLWELRLNDFPKEPLYTLIIDAKKTLHFTMWPDTWVRPRSLIKRYDCV